MRRILLTAVCLFSAACSRKEESNLAPVVEVKVTRAELGEVRNTIEAPATVYPREQASVASRVTAPIREMLVTKGDSVSAGETMAVLESRDLAAAREEAQAAVADAEANFEKTIAGTLPGDVERARGQLTAAEAAYNQARAILDRRQKLYDQGAIPQRELLVSQTELATTKANYEVAKTTLDLLQSQSRERDARMARSRLDQAQARLKQAEAQLVYTRITAPFHGTVTEQFLYPGDMAKPDSPLFTVMDLSVVVARAQTPETEVAAVRPGQDCWFVPADDTGARHQGRITMVNKAVDTARRAVEVWCAVPHPPPSLRPGMFGQVGILTSTSRGVLVPQAAVQLNEGTRTGWVMVVDGKTARKREIEAGRTAGGQAEVVRGLKQGELVVTEGAYGLVAGTEVTIAGTGK